MTTPGHQTGGHTLPPPVYFKRAEEIFGHRYRVRNLVAVSRERALFRAYDLTLQRHVSLRAHFHGDPPVRAWFMREAEALARLDHPAVRHVYDTGIIDKVAFRVGNWIEGESLEEAVRRSPRPLPSVHILARDVLSAMEHAHANGLIIRRVVPNSLIVNGSGHGTVTDLRYASWTLSAIPEGVQPVGATFMAPEIRGGAVGDPASDLYAAGAIIYYAVTAVEPPADPGAIIPPRELRPNCPGAVERIILRALQADPEDRYMTAAEMLEDFSSEAGLVENPPILTVSTERPREVEDGRNWEKRLRRALGDDYELLAQLGAGGFGRVYRVRDLHLEREVALKVLHPLLTTDPAVVERFRREAQLAARLTHPNIVDIYDIGGRSGLIWYTMELISGPNLAQVVEREGAQPLPRVVDLLKEALSALISAHAAGLVHRDIKPENMLIAPDGGLRITDFGLALALRGQGRFGGATSQSGTPQYASPEQLLGERVDQRSDLYSVAAVAYFLLLGHSPFPGHTPEQVLARQATNRVPDLRRERPDVPEALAAALERAIRAVVSERFTTAAEFLQAVQEGTGPSLPSRGAAWLAAARSLFQEPGDRGTDPENPKP